MLRLFVFVCCAATLAHADPAPPAPFAHFIQVDHARFVDGTARFSFVGANLEVMHGEVNRKEAPQTIAAARRDGLRVGRIWALGEGAVDAGAYTRAHELFRAGADGQLDGGPEQLDAVVEAAGRQGLRLVVVLANHWADYGGAPMYLGWAGRDPRTERDAFYDDPSVRRAYLAHVTRILSRTNLRTGVRYVDDPTVMAWELINESQVETQAGASARLAWLTEMAGEVHRLAPRQLVSAGIWGYGTRAERAMWRAGCALPSIDYCDSHLYPETTDGVDTPGGLDLVVDDRAQLAHFVVGKPLVLGEFGFDTRAATPARGGLGRAGWFRRLLGRARLDGVDGTMAWIYQPWSGRERDFGIYVDRPDTDDIRGALSDAAAVVDRVGHNPRLGPGRGARPLYPVYRTLRQVSPVAVVGDGLGLDPTRPHVGRWERVGRYEPPDGARPHAYGSPDGSFTWRFRLAAAARVVTVRARLSSEFPGTHAPADGGSTVVVRLDGQLIGRVQAIPDDGIGRVESVVARGLAAGPHALTFTVEPGPKAHGLCVYGPEPIELLLK